jgi:hypothetical protein
VSWGAVLGGGAGAEASAFFFALPNGRRRQTPDGSIVCDYWMLGSKFPIANRKLSLWHNEFSSWRVTFYECCNALHSLDEGCVGSVNRVIVYDDGMIRSIQVMEALIENARNSVESSGSLVIHSTTPFSV